MSDRALIRESWTSYEGFNIQWYTAVSRKVVEKSARDNLERYCGWFLVHCFSKNGKKFHGRMFASAKGKQQKQVRQLQCQEQVS